MQMLCKVVSFSLKHNNETFNNNNTNIGLKQKTLVFLWLNKSIAPFFFLFLTYNNMQARSWQWHW